MSVPVISVESLSKAFQIYQKPADMMLELITRKRRHDLFWALKDISFVVNEHDRIGIIGANGSGKSTLLKIISGNLQPTSGTVVVRGNISAMLSLATSLNPEETGLSNIRFNLMLNGCPKSQIAQVTEEVIEFTELGSFIYQPVKTYSSGMNAKLAFGIATAIEPEILIVDEVLSVGDGYFVSKAMKRMVSLCERGKALLFVSHAINAVQLLCNKVIWMENGAIRMVGPSEHVLKLYEEDYRRREDELSRAGNKTRADEMEGSGRMEDLLSVDLVKLRLVADGGGAFHDTHYIRRLVCRELVSGAVISNLELVDALDRNDQHLGLDLYNSEWGRGFERQGSSCRTLAPRTGKSRGGHFAIQMPPEYGDGTEVQIEVESQGLSGGERLVCEYLNYETGNWELGRSAGEDLLDGEWTRARTKRELADLLGGRVPFGPVHTVADIFADPHVRARGMLAEVDHPGSARKSIVAGTPIHLSETPGGVKRRAPYHGEHTLAMLRDLGYSDSEIAAMQARRAVLAGGEQAAELQ